MPGYALVNALVFVAKQNTPRHLEAAKQVNKLYPVFARTE